MKDQTPSVFFKQIRPLLQHIIQKGLVHQFDQEPTRTARFFLEAGPLTVDISKQPINNELIQLFTEYASQTQFTQKRDALFNGSPINTTENRAVLHWLLRSAAPDNLTQEKQEVESTLIKMKQFVEAVTSGKWQSATGQKIKHIVNLGVGGSDLGPRLALGALAEFRTNLDLHFVANIDGYDLSNTLESLNPHETLFVITSKTFTTLETLENAKAAKAWLAAADILDVSQHFVAATSRPDSAQQFGIASDNIFPMWDWVGGRYSLLSSVGLSVMLGIGYDNFEALALGAQQIDHHFQTTELENNVPFMLAVVGISAVNGLDMQNHAVISYDSRLELFSNYLQQLEMESNGKSVNLNGEAIDYMTCPIVWGGIGTNTQHSFHQLLHQGKVESNVDFLMPTAIEANNKANLKTHTENLQANCLAQAQALLVGKNVQQVTSELQAQGLNAESIAKLAPHKVISGNRPSTIIGYHDMSPKVLGALIALYEHKVFVQSHFWDINAYDQWGVELGKKLSTPVYDGIHSKKLPINVDPSTQAWIQRLHSPAL